MLDYIHLLLQYDDYAVSDGLLVVPVMIRYTI